MTDRERFNRQMHYQSVDRSFNREFGFWEENFSQWDLFTDNNIAGNHEVDEFFSFDKMWDIGGQTFMYPWMEEKVIEVKEKTKVIINGDGLMAEIPLEGGGSSIPHFIKSSIETPDDWKKMKEEHFDLKHPGRKIDIENFKKHIPPDDVRDFPLGVYCGSMIGKIRDILTFEGLAYAIYENPDMLEDMVETCCLIVEDTLDQLLPHFKFDFASGWEDICYKSGPIVTVNFFRDVVMPRYKRIDKKLKAYGIDIWYTDCDGDVKYILPYFLEGGINCMFPFEVNSSGHPGALLDKYEGQLRILGGVDKMELGRGPEAIKACLESLEKYVAKGGFIPFCDHRCPPNVKPADYLYYLDLKQKMFG